MQSRMRGTSHHRLETHVEPRNEGLVKESFVQCLIYNTPGNNPYRMGEVELQNDLAFYRYFL